MGYTAAQRATILAKVKSRYVIAPSNQISNSTPTISYPKKELSASLVDTLGNVLDKAKRAKTGKKKQRLYAYARILKSQIARKNRR